MNSPSSSSPPQNNTLGNSSSSSPATNSNNNNNQQDLFQQQQQPLTTTTNNATTMTSTEDTTSDDRALLEEEEDLIQLEDLTLNSTNSNNLLGGVATTTTSATTTTTSNSTTYTTTNNNDIIPKSPEQAMFLGKKAIKEFFTQRSCYDAMQLSGKVVVFDCNISLRLISQALEEHEIQCAPIWNPYLQRLVGIVSLSEISEIYRHAMLRDEQNEIFDAHSPLSWRVLLSNLERIERERLQQQQQQNAMINAAGGERGHATATSFITARRQRNVAIRTRFSTVSPTTSLLDSISLMLRERTCQVSVVDDNSQTCYYVQNLSFILEYLVRRFRDDRNLFDHSVIEYQIGTYTNLISASIQDSFATVLALLENNNLFAVPLIDRPPSSSSSSGGSEGGIIVDTFRRNWASRFQSHNITQPNRDTPIRTVLDSLREEFILPRPVTILKSLATLKRIVVLLNESKSSCVYIVDDDSLKFIGVCSLTDVFGYFCSTTTSPKLMNEGL
jgi:CBS-domain-containing membrane protein